MKRFFQNILKKSGNTYKYNYYKSIDYLPIFNFFKIIETDDKRFLIKIEDYEILPEHVNANELNKIWENIQAEYSKAEDSNSAIIQFTTAKGVCKMELEYLVLWNIHNLMGADIEGDSVKAMLKYAGLEDWDLKRIQKRLKALTNKINLKRKAFKEDNFENKKFDFWKILDEINDSKGYRLDPTKVTVREYIAIKKNIKRNGERQNREKRRNKS